jgi:hypothetical protein
VIQNGGLNAFSTGDDTELNKYLEFRCMILYSETFVQEERPYSVYTMDGETASRCKVFLLPRDSILGKSITPV